MKKPAVLILFIISAIASAGTAHAGTIYAGAQAWYSMWDSGMAQLQADIAESAINIKIEEYETEINSLVSALGSAGSIEADIQDPETKGYLAGPVLGYRTSDKLWAFELTTMLLGAYTSEMDTVININYSVPFLGQRTLPVKISTELEIEQKEINLEAGRGLGDFFSVLAGYKYMSFETSLDMDYDFTILGNTLFTTENSVMYKSDMHMVYVGAGANYPVSGALSAKAKLSLGLPFYGSSENELIIDGTDYSTDYEIEMAYFVMGSIALNYTISSSVSIDLGYQARSLTLTVAGVDKDLDCNTEGASDYSDLFHGAYLNAVYMFDI